MLVGMTEQKAFNENNLLEVAIDGMFISDDKKEVLDTYNFARKKLEMIYLYNLDRIDRAETLHQDEKYQQLELEIPKYQ